MKRMLTLLAVLTALCGRAQEAVLPNPDAKSMAMGGVAMTTLSGSHAIYGNSATAVFSMMPSQISSSYYGQGDFDSYAVSGYWRFDVCNLVQAGWRQYLRERGNSDMAVDLGYSRRIGERWALGLVGRYVHLSRPDGSADALAADVSAAYMLPLDLGSYSTLRAGAKLGNLGGYLDGVGRSLPMDLTMAPHSTPTSRTPTRSRWGPTSATTSRRAACGDFRWRSVPSTTSCSCCRCGAVTISANGAPTTRATGPSAWGRGSSTCGSISPT